MNIPQSVIRPFEPHGIPVLRNMAVDNIKSILDIMDALDKFMADNADNFFSATPILDNKSIRLLGRHLGNWLEKIAMDAGADIVHAKASAMLAEFIGGKELPVFDTDNRRKKELEVIGFMFLIDFTVNDEDIKHMIEYRFKRRRF